MAFASPAHAATFLTHAQAVSQLHASGITIWSSGNCSNRYNSSRTSFEQVRQTTISGIRTLKSASGCAINLTAGTEVGHASGTYSHWNGYKLDMSKYSCISSYIKNNFTYVGTSPAGATNGARAPGTSTSKRATTGASSTTTAAVADRYCTGPFLMGRPVFHATCSI